MGVNNEKAQSASFADRLLWRYHNPKDECDAKNQEPPVLAAVINFAVVAFVLFKFGRGPVMAALAARKKSIMQDIDTATTLRDEAKARLREYEKKLATIEERRKELHAESRAQWDIEQKRILAEASDKAARLRKDAEFRVSQELKSAELDLLKSSVDGAVAAAEELLRNRINDTDQDRLASEYLAGLGTLLTTERRPS